MTFGVKHEPVIRKQADPEPFADAVERARASYAAGTGVEHRVVSEWLRTWGTSDRRTFREWLAAWNG